MTWGNPPKFENGPKKQGKKITPEQLAGDSEHSQQVALFAWAALNVGKYPQLAYMFAIPNGFFGSAEQKAKMKAEGLRTGVCDVFLPTPIRKRDYQGFGEDWKYGYHGCFIEMKIEKYRNHKDGGCSETQIDFINHVVHEGYYCKVCYNWEEARDILIKYIEIKI